MTIPVTTETAFLRLNALLQQTLAFAKDNPYQHQPLSPARLVIFAEQMQQLFIFNERWQLLPAQVHLTEAEPISELYPETQSGLFDLLYSCPLPAEAEHWFDYQQEFQARTQQIGNLSTLINWHQQFYQQLLQQFPRLPLTGPVLAHNSSDVPPDPAAQAGLQVTAVTQPAAGNHRAEAPLPNLIV